MTQVYLVTDRATARSTLVRVDQTLSTAEAALRGATRLGMRFRGRHPTHAMPIAGDRAAFEIRWSEDEPREVVIIQKENKA